jgi:hypothetical protein
MGATPSTWSLSTTSTVSMTRERAPALPLTERQRDERPPARFGSSPEYGLPKSDTNLAALLAAAGRCPDGRGARGPGVGRGPRRGFCLGNQPGCATLLHTARLRRRGAAHYRQPLDYPASAARARPREDSRRSSRRFSSHASAGGCASRPSLSTFTSSLAISSPLESGYFQPGASIAFIAFAPGYNKAPSFGGTGPNI